MSNSLQIHHQPEQFPDRRVPDPHQDTFSKTFLGFWLYIITDCLIFATLFVTYAILHRNTFDGVTSKDIFDLSLAFTETMILLFSSLTCGLATLAFIQGKLNKTLSWLTVTFILGALFIGFELKEFNLFIQEGHSWRESAFLSAFFTLVGTHGMHVSLGLVWMGVMMGQLYLEGITKNTFRRLVTFSLFLAFSRFNLDFYFYFCVFDGGSLMDHDINLQEMQHRWHANFKGYLIGFLASFILTSISFLLVIFDFFPPVILSGVITILGMTQAIVQLIYFLHLLGEGALRWEPLLFFLMIIVLLIIALGSLWVMSDLNLRVMPHMG